MKTSAIAYPIQGLIKYHGLRDEELRLPYHDSISVCSAPIRTLTTIDFGQKEDGAQFDGKVARRREMERILKVVEPLRTLANERSGFKMVSENSFPSNIGLGASASGFAALAVAASAALGLDMSLEEISRFARRGAGSASRAVTRSGSAFAPGFSSFTTTTSHATIMAGSVVGSVIAMLGGVGDHAPHGGPIVLPVIDNRAVYVTAIAAGCLVVALVINALRRFAAGRAGREA